MRITDQPVSTIQFVRDCNHFCKYDANSQTILALTLAAWKRNSYTEGKEVLRLLYLAVQKIKCVISLGYRDVLIVKTIIFLKINYENGISFVKIPVSMDTGPLKQLVKNKCDCFKN